MKGIMIAGLAMILAAAVPFTVLGEARDGRARGTEHAWGFEAHMRFHAFVLGTEPRHYCSGKPDADDHPPVVQPPVTTPPSTGSGSGLTGSTGSTSGTVTSSGPGTL